MDEAASKLRMEMNPNLKNGCLGSKIMQLEIEIEAIKRENDTNKLKSRMLIWPILRMNETKLMPNGNQRNL